MSLNTFTVPPQCSRGNRTIFVEEDLIKALKQLSWKRAEDLPSNSYIPYYVGNKYIELMRTNTNNIVWGRRGTGKTHLLKSFDQQINSDANSLDISFYISCDNIKYDSPIDDRLCFDSDNIRTKYYAHQCFVKFLEYFFDLILRSYEKILSKKVTSSMKRQEQRSYKQRVDSVLLELMELTTLGVPTIDKQVEFTRTYEADEKNRQRGISLSVSNIFHKGLNAPINVNLSRKRTYKRRSDKSKESTIVYTFSFSSLRKAMIKLIEAMQVETLYICIDELSQINRHRDPLLQPLFLDYLRQTFFGVSNIGVKIAAIRETTKLSNKCTQDNNYGLQSRQDIFELFNFDTMHMSSTDREQFFLEMLQKRLNFRILDSDGPVNKNWSQDYIIECIFKEKRYFSKIVSLSQGIPRQFFDLLQTCLGAIDYDISRKYIHSYLSADVVISSYLEDKRSNLALSNGTCKTILDLIKSYVKKSGHYFFIIKNEQLNRTAEIDNIIYNEIIHRIASSLTPNEIMDTHKAFFVDAGLYFSNFKNTSEFFRVVESHEILIPCDLAYNFSKYEIDIEDIESNFEECPRCSYRTSRLNPVFVKFKSCVNCAYTFD